VTTPHFTRLLQTLHDISSQNKKKNIYGNLRVTPYFYLPCMKKKLPNMFEMLTSIQDFILSCGILWFTVNIRAVAMLVIKNISGLNSVPILQTSSPTYPVLSVTHLCNLECKFIQLFNHTNKLYYTEELNEQPLVINPLKTKHVSFI
jgi:hypothetical protein